CAGYRQPPVPAGRYWLPRCRPASLPKCFAIGYSPPPHRQNTNGAEWMRPTLRLRCDGGSAIRSGAAFATIWLATLGRRAPPEAEQLVQPESTGSADGMRLGFQVCVTIWLLRAGT